MSMTQTQSHRSVYQSKYKIPFTNERKQCKFHNHVHHFLVHLLDAILCSSSSLPVRRDSQQPCKSGAQRSNLSLPKSIAMLISMYTLA